MTAVRGEQRSGDCSKKVKGLKNMCEGPVERDNGVGIDCRNEVLVGWSGAKRENRDNCNSINNKNKNKTSKK